MSGLSCWIIISVLYVQICSMSFIKLIIKTITQHAAISGDCRSYYILIM